MSLRALIARLFLLRTGVAHREIVEGVWVKVTPEGLMTVAKP